MIQVTQQEAPSCLDQGVLFGSGSIEFAVYRHAR